MRRDLKRLLEHLAATLDPERQAAIDRLHARALRWEPVPRLPIVFTFPLPDDLPFRPYPHGMALADPEAMLWNELVHAFGTSIACWDRIDDDLPATIRPNFGTVLLATLFGGRVEERGDAPPWALPFPDAEAFEAAFDGGPPDPEGGWIPRVLARYRFYRETLAAHPPLGSVIRIVLPDLQGPFDTVLQLRGSAIFLDLIDAPDRVARALEAVARAQIAAARRLAGEIRDGPAGLAHQHAAVIRGRILIRDDAAVLVDPAIYAETIASHDERVLCALGGGGIHACGRVDRHAPAWLALPSIRCIDLGEPARSDLDAIYAMARARRVALVRVRVPEEELVTGRVVDRFPTGVTLVHEARSIEDARRILRAYRRATGG